MCRLLFCEGCSSVVDVVCGLLRVACCLLIVVCGSLLVVGCWLMVNGYV